MKITWLGHSGFRIEIEDQTLLVDPWIDGNPSFPEGAQDEAVAGATAIVLTHGHGDHASSTVAIAKDLDIPIACIHELSNILAGDGAKVIGFGKGGTIALGSVKVTMVNAVHSSSIDYKDTIQYAGDPAGFMIAGEGHTVYVSGDTDLMADMAWFADYHKPDIGILSAGGHYTMDMERVAYACRTWFNFATVIPCHWGTFPLLAQNCDVLVEALGEIVRVPEVLVPIEI